MKILVTGGAGFIGSHIVDMLVEGNHSVAVVDNLHTGSREQVNEKARFYQVDITSQQLEEVMVKERPQVIIHQAALVFVQQSIENPLSDGLVNVLGTLNLLQAAARHGVKKIVYASTCAAYGETGEKPIGEEQPSYPISFYGASKYMGELYVGLFAQHQNLDYTILRYANVYGPRQKSIGEGGVIPIFIQKMLEGIAPNIFGLGDQTRDFIYVADVARANLLALDKGSGQTINIGSGTGTSILQLYKTIAGILQFSQPPIYGPAKQGDLHHSCLDINKAAAALGWENKYSLAQGLAITVDYFKNGQIYHKGGLKI